MDTRKLLNTIDLFSEKFKQVRQDTDNIEIQYILSKLIEMLEDFEYELVLINDNINDQKLIEFNNWENNTINEFNKLFKV